MQNIAFATLVILILSVPGYLCRSVYFSGQFTRQLLPRTWTDDIAKAVVYSLPFHAAWILVFELLQHNSIIHHTFTFEAAFRILAGEYGDVPWDYEYRFSAIVQKVYRNMKYLALYYFFAVISAAGAGVLLRTIVWNKELDVKLTWLRYRSEWLYKIMGRGQLKDVPWRDTEAWIDALSEQDSIIPGKSVLYRGLAAGYTTEENGALRDIILTDVKRTAGEREVSGEPKWTPIPGRFLVLSYSKVRNLNITYEQHSRQLLRQIQDLPTA